MARTSNHIIVCGVGFGDEGKGGVTDWLCSSRGTALRGERPVAAVVRHNGGAQAAHTVVHPGREHTFAQFGSGSFHGTPTFLSRHMLLDPLALAAEAAHLASLGVPALDLLTVDRDALIITPYHIAANQARELAREHWRHGSCGRGIGETARLARDYPDLALRVRDCAAPPPELRRRLGDIRDALAAGVTRELDRILTHSVDAAHRRRISALRRQAGGPAAAAHPEPPAPRELEPDPAALDGAVFGLPADQYLRGPGPAGENPRLPDLPGLDDLADAYRAFAGRVALADGDPHLRHLLKQGPVVFEGAQGVLLDERYGFHPYTTWSTTTPANARALLTEHGEQGYVLGVTRTYMTRHGPGPFVTEDASLDFPEPHNGTGQWQGAFRLGHPDALALDYAVQASGGIDGLAVTHLDVNTRRLRMCSKYRGPHGSEITRLNPDPFPDLSWQEGLTRVLSAARPVYENAPVAPDTLAHDLSWVAKAPLVLRSYGPGPESKTAAAEVPA